MFAIEEVLGRGAGVWAVWLGELSPGAVILERLVQERRDRLTLEASTHEGGWKNKTELRNLNIDIPGPI